jgi:nitrate reductase assembly molybdenum cofactor insertion protein NarJ
MEREMYTDSVSRDRKRLLTYKLYSAALNYPDEQFFHFFPQLNDGREKVARDYDRLFRRGGIWLYTTEHTALGEFQKSKFLSDIMGFYTAFGLEPHGERPDSLPIELEFMHYLIFKGIHAIEKKLQDYKGKNLICLDAQRKFFNEHLYPGAKAIGEKISTQSEESVYREIVTQMVDFLEVEKKFLKYSNK